MVLARSTNVDHQTTAASPPTVLLADYHRVWCGGLLLDWRLMAYLNLDPTYFTHRKTIRLVALLGPGSEALPIKLWAHCATYHPKDGALLDYEQAELGVILGHKEAVPALVKVGFLDPAPDGKGWVCHDWLDHQGHLAAFKDRAERAAKARWDKARKLKGDASNAQASDKQCPIPAVPTKPSVPANQRNPAPDWARVLATDIAKHVQVELGKNTQDHQVESWARSLDKLTRSTALAPKATPEEVEQVIRWGMLDLGSGSWPGWSKQIRSAPDVDKFVKIRASMANGRAKGQRSSLHTGTQADVYASDRAEYEKMK